MLILALDTTTRGGSLALWRDGAVDERPGDATHTHAERLPADLAAIVADHGVTLADVDLYVVASGPGSFTGMRVGIATIQGLALVHDRPVVAIPTLEALAQFAARATRRPFVGAWMDAYRGEVFAELFRVTSADDAIALEPVAAAVAATPAAAVDGWCAALGAPQGEAIDAGKSLAIIGDGVPASTVLLRDRFGPDVELRDAPLLAGTLAAVAAAHPERAARPHAVVPEYVRRPDAILGRERRETEVRAGSDVTPAR